MNYAKNPPNLWRYLLVMIFFACGLMSKSMLVTLPFVLLLLDYWPLGRFGELKAKGNGVVAILRSRVVLEKLLLLALTAGSCVVAVVMQGNAVQSLEEYPFGLRVANAVVSVAVCIRLDVILSCGALAVFYPYPAHGLPGIEVNLSRRWCWQALVRWHGIGGGRSRICSPAGCGIWECWSR